MNQDNNILNWSQEIYLKAYRFAAEAHNGQLVPGTDLPYLMHISYVTMEVIACLTVEQEHDGNLAVQCALLHDVIEDTAITYQDVEATFGNQVAQGVLALTKNDALPKAEAMADSLHRIRQQPQSVWIVKLADRITNLAPPPHHWNKEKIKQYRAEASKIYEALHTASNYLGHRLLSKMDQYQAYL